MDLFYLQAFTSALLRRGLSNHLLPLWIGLHLLLHLHES